MKIHKIIQGHPIINSIGTAEHNAEPGETTPTDSKMKIAAYTSRE
jgi:hypothetical protein